MYGIRRMKGGCWRLLCAADIAGTLAMNSGNDPTKLYDKTPADLQRDPFWLSEHDALIACAAIAKFKNGVKL